MNDDRFTLEKFTDVEVGDNLSLKAVSRTKYFVGWAEKPNNIA